MRYTKEERDSRRVLALGLVTLYVMKGYDHVTLSSHKYDAEVTVYVDTEEEAKKAEQESQLSIVAGCSSQIQKWHNENGDYYTYSVEY